MKELYAFVLVVVLGAAALMWFSAHTWFCISRYTCTANAPGWPDNIKGPGIGLDWR